MNDCDFCYVVKYYANEKTTLKSYINKVENKILSMEDLKKRLCKKHYDLVTSNLKTVKI